MESKSALNNHVLVLNKNWTVIGTTIVEKAIMLICRESAKGICPESFNIYNWEEWISEINNPKVDAYIKTPSIDVPAPQIILLTKYDDVYCQDIKFHSRAIFRRDGFRCMYCGEKRKVEDLSIDHIIPKSKKGPTSWENCVTACFPCNNKKSNKSLDEIGMKLLKKPKKPNWNPIRDDVKQIPDSWKNLLKKDWNDA